MRKIKCERRLIKPLGQEERRLRQSEEAFEESEQHSRKNAPERRRANVHRPKRERYRKACERDERRRLRKAAEHRHRQRRADDEFAHLKPRKDDEQAHATACRLCDRTRHRRKEDAAKRCSHCQKDENRGYKACGKSLLPRDAERINDAIDEPDVDAERRPDDDRLTRKKPRSERRQTRGEKRRRISSDKRRTRPRPKCGHDGKCCQKSERRQHAAQNLSPPLDALLLP